MLIKILEIRGVKYLTSCSVSSSRLLTFYCHNEVALQTFTESFPYDEFRKRLLTLNPRVKFPENAVKTTLLERESAHATMATGPNSAGVWVMALKYTMVETPAPLKWEWHLKPMSTAKFYRQLLVDAIDVGHELHVIIKTMTKDLCAKDKELEQFRREGCELRRTTVKTKTFDMIEFEEENKDLLDEATAYNEINEVFPNDFPGSSSNSRDVSSTPTTPSTTSSSSGKPTSTSSSSNTTSSSSNTPERISSARAIAARSRKRKAEAININRLEQKIKQRLQQPEVKFNSQSSQEDDFADWLVESARDVRIKQQSKAVPQAVPKLVPQSVPQTVKQPVPQSVPDPSIKKESEAKKVPKPETAEVKNVKSEEPEKPTTNAEENNNDTLTESDQELNELRAILSASMAKRREQRQK
ncbi:hypothetical protein KR038_009452 [Drosophila bunnanda]|nr:hypothetical protein KR038_009452 [Drosophila bunnanda]